jgi:CDP-diacylglycerol--serine O-phosphatidyltransferase
LIRAPWPTLLVLAVFYLLMIPVALLSYARVKRRRASAAARA